MIRDWKTISKEEAEQAILNAKSFKQALNNLNYNGQNTRLNYIIKELSVKYNISLNHFSRNIIKPGTHFGKWTVLSLSSKTDSSSNRYYWCECSCEQHTKREIMGTNLRNGNSTSCGCAISEKAKKHNSLDLTGQKFNNLTVINIDIDSYNRLGVNLWNCKCDCGNICKVSTSDLRTGHRIDCGNHTSERISSSSREDLTGQKFNCLTALYPIFKNNKTYWFCKCDCGRETEVVPGHLKSGHTKTCGLCTRSYGEIQVEKALKELNINFTTQKCFKDLKGNNGKLLSFDFYLSDYNILIECQGLQHYKSIEFYGGEKRFERQQINDKQKKEYCKSHSLKLIEILYYDYEKIDKEYLLKLLQIEAAI